MDSRGRISFFKEMNPSELFLLKMTHIPTRPSRDINKKNILVKIIMTIEAKLWTLVNKVLNKSKLVTYILIRHDPYSNFNKILSRETFWFSFMKTKAKMWPLECKQGFKEI